MTPTELTHVPVPTPGAAVAARIFRLVCIVVLISVLLYAISIFIHTSKVTGERLRTLEEQVDTLRDTTDYTTYVLRRHGMTDQEAVDFQTMLSAKQEFRKMKSQDWITYYGMVKLPEGGRIFYVQDGQRLSVDWRYTNGSFTFLTPVRSDR